MKPSGLVIYCCEQTTLKHDDFKKLIISYICVLMGFSRVLLLFHLLSGTAVIWDSAGLEHPDGLLVCLGVEKAEVLGRMGLSHLSPPPLALSPRNTAHLLSSLCCFFLSSLSHLKASPCYFSASSPCSLSSMTAGLT